MQDIYSKERAYLDYRQGSASFSIYDGEKDVNLPYTQADSFLNLVCRCFYRIFSCCYSNQYFSLQIEQQKDPTHWQSATKSFAFVSLSDLRKIAPNVSAEDIAEIRTCPKQGEERLQKVLAILGRSRLSKALPSPRPVGSDGKCSPTVSSTESDAHSLDVAVSSPAVQQIESVDVYTLGQKGMIYKKQDQQEPALVAQVLAQRKLGSGAMGSVVLARSPTSTTEKTKAYAYKTFSRIDERRRELSEKGCSVEGFEKSSYIQRERKIYRQLQDENIPGVLSCLGVIYGEDEKEAGLLFPLCQEGSLDSYLKGEAFGLYPIMEPLKVSPQDRDAYIDRLFLKPTLRGELKAEDSSILIQEVPASNFPFLMTVFERTAETTSSMHKKGLFVNDMKKDNIFLDVQGGRAVSYVADCSSSALEEPIIATEKYTFKEEDLAAECFRQHLLEEKAKGRLNDSLEQTYLTLRKRIDVRQLGFLMYEALGAKKMMRLTESVKQEMAAANFMGDVDCSADARERSFIAFPSPYQDTETRRIDGTKMWRPDLASGYQDLHLPSWVPPRLKLLIKNMLHQDPQNVPSMEKVQEELAAIRQEGLQLSRHKWSIF